MTFGDFEEADAFDREPPDPEQLARKLCELAGDRWSDLTLMQRVERIQIITEFVEWLRREGSLR